MFLQLDRWEEALRQLGSLTLSVTLAAGSLIPISAAGVAAPAGGCQAAKAEPTSACAIAQAASLPPAVPPLPDALPNVFRPESSGIVGLHPEPEQDIGVGHLRPRNLEFFETSEWIESPLRGAGWLSEVAIPLYESPEGRHWGWIVNGWLVPNGYEPIAIGRDASFTMLQTFYDLFSFPVVEMRPDGWFRFQYSSAGTVWAHSSHLSLGDIELTVELWEDRFLEVGWVYFRNQGAAYALRSQPDTSQPLVSSVGNDSFIVPLLFEGDWMQVRVTQPVNGCDFLPGARTQEGWMRWRLPDQGPRVWYPPKGC
ncbi:hypothetical protein [Sphaerothrix gracilis]|uniref:hypothetical protein n=1 Tax=Sphaerothrix gracilis TaxID=3151835 RepID=UPI0031FD9A83